MVLTGGEAGGGVGADAEPPGVELGKGRGHAGRGVDDLAVAGLVAAPVRGAAFDAALAGEATVARELAAAALEAAQADALALAGGRLVGAA